MALNNWKDRLRGFFARGLGDGTRRPDGGTNCYRPMQRHDAEQAVPYGQSDFGQPVPYAHTGFTGMTPPANFVGEMPGYSQGPVYEPTGYEPGYAMGQNNRSGIFSQQTNYSRNSFSRAFPDMQEQHAARPERGWFPPREEPKNNISYMPGYAPENAPSGGTHVEHIMTMTGLKSCYDAIECMKNGETLIVVLDAIANESESLRCQDMLAGAAFTLGCGVRMLQGGKVVLIAPETVRILPEQAPARPEMKPAYAPPPAPRSAEPAPARRERRSGARAEEWNAARNGELEGYNPYTGTMPVAAGSYASFGGYGL